MLPSQPWTYVLFFLLAFPNLVCGEDPEISVVTFGSTIKLQHTASSHRLHSHDVSYGTGSGQQSVTAVSDTGDANSFWIVKSAHEVSQKPAGTVIKCGDTIRLQHLRTSKNLHSHEHRAPMNRDKEVSAYGHLEGRWSSGDEGDNWQVECVKGNGEWQRGADVRFRHTVSGYYLASHPSLRFGDPIPGQLQVSAASRKGSNTVWRTSEGFYLAPPRNK